jgi:hypothetical protein
MNYSISLICYKKATILMILVARVRITTSGNEKTRVSVAFDAAANGAKLKPVIIIPRARPLPDYTPPDNVIVAYHNSGNFNEVVFGSEVIRRSVLSYLLSNGLTNPILVYDHAPCHTTSSIKSLIKVNNLKKNEL